MWAGQIKRAKNESQLHLCLLICNDGAEHHGALQTGFTLDIKKANLAPETLDEARAMFLTSTAFVFFYAALSQYPQCLVSRFPHLQL